jgi:hypothetical protein
MDSLDILDLSEPSDIVQMSFSLQEQIVDLEKTVTIFLEKEKWRVVNRFKNTHKGSLD